MNSIIWFLLLAISNLSNKHNSLCTNLDKKFKTLCLILKNLELSKIVAFLNPKAIQLLLILQAGFLYIATHKATDNQAI